MMNKTAFITGITGQDGSYLAELLLEKGYEVYGLFRRGSTNTAGRIAHLLEKRSAEDRRLHLLYGDMTDSLNLVRLMLEIRPDEVYNLAAQSHVAVSFEEPEYTADTDGIGVLRILEAVRAAGLADTARIYQASTSELYGKAEEIPQKETTPFHPRSPYAAAKLYGYWIIRNYREAYGMFAVNGILFNHESPRRGENFVTRKITRAVGEIAAGRREKLYLGNLEAKRDWGYAGDYVECMWRMLQHDVPEDFVIATGETHTVREFAEAAFRQGGMELLWKGEGVEERGIDRRTGKVLVEVSPEFFRPAEVDLLLGDPSRAKKLLGWNPGKTSFEELVKRMVEHDMAEALQGRERENRAEGECFEAAMSEGRLRK